ncbi:FKBP-type peptidyl-prolyl cis-trans isomerase [Lacihabitans sp. LS3-19]|uniref:FKBP-type peptidyl-prolyl cis-trans isomerase n=1 Tax=Lacihabitans sp. LS3-19 TaxID=2487335 RepID=UPI0020CBC231|nr:FKBP-type peptidyl-prolyl cis-trans isomerase [Lacihabitans sp. LS3-19]MCP9770314.1 FKBP-type peptidyl-prolyl cis-trans isomerase [Lacihabitans sp. LS3-19]
MKFNKSLVFGLLVLVLFSCEKDTLTGTEDEQIETYIAQKNLTVTEKTATGLRYIRTKENATGTQLRVGRSIALNYVGKLLTGKKFDSGTFSFTLGAGQVIKGFDEGIAKMRVGEKATLIFPSSIGYGSKGTSGIPGNSPLLFEIEVLSTN